MIDHTPEGWGLQRRGPQHAAPFGNSASARFRTLRAVRLMITAGAWGAGLCLVVGLVALEAGRSGQVAHLASTARDGDGPVRSTTTNAVQVQHVFNGTGNQVTEPFRIGPRGRWKLGWSYQCAAPGTAGYLSISEPGRGAAVSVTAAGPAGRGQTWADTGAGRRRLAIRSNCAWTVRVAEGR